ncbi:MAG: hypothetical protein R2769_12710 [Saprospiraceae bacterium]
MTDIMKELEKPGLDQGEMQSFEFGNVIPWKICIQAWCCHGYRYQPYHFGAFVDIGVKQDGLVHLSDCQQVC